MQLAFFLVLKPATQIQAELDPPALTLKLVGCTWVPSPEVVLAAGGPDHNHLLGFVILAARATSPVSPSAVLVYTAQLLPAGTSVRVFLTARQLLCSLK